MHDQAFSGLEIFGSRDRMHSQRVLIIEDETSAREPLASLLCEEGYVVRTAASGIAGLQTSGSFAPDIIICDYYLPDINGVEVLQRIREAQKSSAHFIVITAGLVAREDETYLRRTAAAFLAKPIALDDLHAALEKCAPGPEPGSVLHATYSKDHRHA
jgi:CheY-like chemotaxis protein